MIEKMNEKTQGPVFKIIFALVSLSFVLGGLGGGLMMRDNSAVKVNGEEISQIAFTQAKHREQTLRNNLEGESFWDKMDDPTYLEQFNNSIFNQLIDEELLRQYAKELKLNVSSEQVKSQIVHTPSFQQNGKFDNALYQQTLRNNGISADHYASLVAQGMIINQLQEGIIGTDFNVPAQQELLAKFLLQSRQIRVATFPIKDEINNQKIEESELQSFFDKHTNNFKSPEKFIVEYVLLSPKDVENKIEISDTQIETYYQANQGNYITTGESNFAHIQLATEEQAKDVLQAVQNGEDFAKLAKEKSQDIGSASQGGDLGWAKAGAFPKAFEDAAAALQIGEVSPVVKIDDAFHIIKLLNRRDGKTTALSEVKEQIAQLIRNELVQSEYVNTARAMAKIAYENAGSLNDMAKLGNIQVQTTHEFEMSNLPEVLNNEQITKLLFSSDLRRNGQISEGIELHSGNDSKTMFLKVSKYTPESLQTFDEAKNAVENAVKLEKATVALQNKVESVVKVLEAGEAISTEFSKPMDIVFAQAQLEQPEVAKAVFSMPKPTDKPSYRMLKEHNGDVLIIALDKITDGSIESFKAVEAQISAADQVLLFKQLLNELRNRATIKINQEFAEQQLNRNN